MDGEHEHRRRSTALGVVGAIAGTAAVVAAPTAGASSTAATASGTTAKAATNGTGPASPLAAGTYESCTALFGLTEKNAASWVLLDVQATRPITPPVSIGPELRAVVTVSGGAGEADVECEADTPAWTTEPGWLAYVQGQRGVPDLSTITGRYPYPGGPGFAIPVVDRSYAPTVGVNLLTDPITVSGASVRFETDATRFSVVGGSPQQLLGLSPSAGADDALARALAIDPSFSGTVLACQSLPTTATDEAITAAVAALGTVWGIDVDAVFPPASAGLDDRCIALDQAQSYYFGTATRSLTVGATATVTVEPPPAPPTTSTSTSSSTTTTTAPDGVAAGAAVVAPTFTG
jgi:hypothetical protein